MTSDKQQWLAGMQYECIKCVGVVLFHQVLVPPWVFLINLPAFVPMEFLLFFIGCSSSNYGLAREIGKSSGKESGGYRLVWPFQQQKRDENGVDAHGHCGNVGKKSASKPR